MGMQVWYELASTSDRLDDARAIIASLREQALELPFDRVSELLPVESRPSGMSGIFAGGSIRVPHAIENNRWRILSVDPIDGVAFIVHAGERCESAAFGLARYPDTIYDDVDGLYRPTDYARGYQWHDGCKTQYAFRLGREHFLRCHIALISLLDRANAMGLVTRVSDEGGYWEHRDVEALLSKRQEHDAVVASIVGSLHDELDGRIDGKLVSPILDDPRFEHLEAEGRRRLDERGTNS
jgi:hypothetical protein